MFVRPPHRGIVRNLRASARARRIRQTAQLRRDAGELSQPVRTARGTVFTGRIASTAPMVYVRDGRAITEWRGEAELARIAQQAPGTPVVVEHPADDRMLSAGSTAPVIGRVLHAHVESGSPSYVIAAVEVTDAGALAEIEDGRRGLSLGYRCDLTDDGEQKNVQLDHLAVVGNPRCQSCSLRTDCGSAPGCRCSSCLDKHPLFAPRKETMSRKPAPDPLIDMAAAEDRARRRDPSATFRSTGQSADEQPTTTTTTPEPASDDDMTSMDAALMRAFLRQ